MRQLLDPDTKTPDLEAFEKFYTESFIGQERVISQLIKTYSLYKGGLYSKERPIARLLLLGPTGTGKTLCAELLAKYLHGSRKKLLKVNCSEFSAGHEVSKLIGSPPGYLGHGDTSVFTESRLDACRSEKCQTLVILFDEIEKAHHKFFELLLSILDKGEIMLGTTKITNLCDSIIFFSSNLGARDMAALHTGSIGFGTYEKSPAEMQQDLYHIGLKAANKHFTPEFMNRISRVLVFRSFERPHLEQILMIEIRKIEAGIRHTLNVDTFQLVISSDACNFLLDEGTKKEFGARELKRTVERFLLYPLNRCFLNHSLSVGITEQETRELNFPIIDVDVDLDAKKLLFYGRL